MNTLIVYDREKNHGPAVIIGSIVSMSAYAGLKDEINDKAYGRLIVVADKDNFKETAKIRNRFAGKNIVLCPVQTEADEGTTSYAVKKRVAYRRCRSRRGMLG